MLTETEEQIHTIIYNSAAMKKILKTKQESLEEADKNVVNFKHNDRKTKEALDNKKAAEDVNDHISWYLTKRELTLKDLGKFRF